MNSRKKLFVGCAIAVGAVLAAVLVAGLAIGLAIGIGIETGRFPDSAAKPAGKIHPRQLKQLLELGVIKPDEKVLYFYSAALFSVRDDGNLFTDQRVISYEEYDGQLNLSEATYDNISSIDFEPSDSWMDDSIITVTLRDGSWFVLYVSAESNGDKAFFQKLSELWKSRTN